MNTKLSNNIRLLLEKEGFDLEYESKMVQSRILSTILEIVDEKKLTQSELSKKTGLKQPFLSALFNLHKKLNMEHIALFQKALDIKLMPPKYLTGDKHKEFYYSTQEYVPASTCFLDSESFEGENFISWLTTNKNMSEKSYSLIESTSFKVEKSDLISKYSAELENYYR